MHPVAGDALSHGPAGSVEQEALTAEVPNATVIAAIAITRLRNSTTVITLLAGIGKLHIWNRGNRAALIVF